MREVAWMGLRRDLRCFPAGGAETGGDGIESLGVDAEVCELGSRSCNCDIQMAETLTEVAHATR